MTANEIIKLLPTHALKDLAVETKVDHQVKKLTGELMFKLILFSIINSNKLSLRVMESFLHSAHFKHFTHYTAPDSKYNSIRDRICTIKADYFEKLFEQVFAVYSKELKEQTALSKADSTYVTLSAKLLSGGMQNGGDQSKRQVKYSVNVKGSLPASVKVFTEQSHISESLALPELLNQADYLKGGGLVVFDRGLQTRDAFDKFTADTKLFIGRSKTTISFTPVVTHLLGAKPQGATVTITSDEEGLLHKDRGKPTQYHYRVIRGTIDASGEEICWVSNVLEEDAYTIAHYYKQRWEIEVFFKFIKQHLNASHLVNRTENGMKVMIYMTMIVAILLLAYRKFNQIKGYKIAKLRFEIELENDIIKEIVILCGGDPSTAPLFWSTA